MAVQKTEPASPWRDGFLFVGNNLALDFLNTCPVQDGEATELLPDFRTLLCWFVAAGQLTSPQATALERNWANTRQSHSFVREARAFRERLRSGVRKWVESGSVPRATIAELNRLLAEHPMRLRLGGDGGSIKAEIYMKAKLPSDLLAPVSDSAAQLFTKEDRERVRRCGNCVLFFLDTSKKGTRHWCSMQLCGNRSKAAAYAQRKRQQVDQ